MTTKEILWVVLILLCLHMLFGCSTTQPDPYGPAYWGSAAKVLHQSLPRK